MKHSVRHTTTQVWLIATATSLVPAGVRAQKLPEIRSPNDAMVQLSLKGEAKQRAALDNLKSACRGRARLALRDNPAVLGRLKSLVTGGSSAVKKAVLDCSRCATPAKLVPLLTAALADPEPAVVAYAAEIAGRQESAALVPALLDARDARKEACGHPDLPAAQLDVCVWLTYAPGTGLGGADEALRERAAQAAIHAFDSPHPKVREVAVETLTASRLGAHAGALKRLIDREKKGDFAKPNDAALIGRFKDRLRTLKKR